jgi:hypothetical protein
MSYPLRGAGLRPSRWSSPERTGKVAAPTPTETPIDEVMAGFIVWLARQDVASGRRSRYRRYAERYLRWQTEHPEQPEDRYHDELRRHGIADAEIRVVSASIALLRRYLIAATAARVS